MRICHSTTAGLVQSRGTEPVGAVSPFQKATVLRSHWYRIQSGCVACQKARAKPRLADGAREAGSGNFTYRPEPDWVIRKFVPHHDAYFLENKLNDFLKNTLNGFLKSKLSDFLENKLKINFSVDQMMVIRGQVETFEKALAAVASEPTVPLVPPPLVLSESDAARFQTSAANLLSQQLLQSQHRLRRARNRLKIDGARSPAHLFAKSPLSMELMLKVFLEQASVGA